jgi:hypothetical protein
LGFISILHNFTQWAAGHTTSGQREDSGQRDGTVWESDGEGDGDDIRCQAWASGPLMPMPNNTIDLR